MDTALRKHLESKAVHAMDNATTDALDGLVKNNLRTDMENTNARSRMKIRFVSYKSLLREHGLSWITKDTEKIAIQHVLTANCPAPLRSRLKYDMELAKTKLCKDFKGLIKHATHLSDAFHLVDTGSPIKTSRTKKGGRIREAF